MLAATWLSSLWLGQSARLGRESSGILMMFWRRTGPRSRSRLPPSPGLGPVQALNDSVHRASQSHLVHRGWVDANSHLQRRRARIRGPDSTHPRGLQPAPGLTMALPRPSQADGGRSSSGLHRPGNLRKLADHPIAYEELHDEIKSTQAHESNRTNTTEIYSKILPQRHAPTQSTRVIHHNDD